MHISKRLLLGLGLATLIMESVVIQPAFAADKVSLFKVITAKDEIVIGISEGDLAQMEGQNAGGVAKMLVAKGSMSAWQYAVRKSAGGDLEQAPLHKIGLIASDSPPRRALCDAAEGAADRRDEEVTLLIPGWSERRSGSLRGDRPRIRHRACAAHPPFGGTTEDSRPGICFDPGRGSVFGDARGPSGSAPCRLGRYSSSS